VCGEKTTELEVSIRAGLGSMTEERLSALLVHNGAEHFRPLESALESQSVYTRRAATCGEALLILRGLHPPQLVFTDTILADGNWACVLRMAAGAPTPVNVIVVARLVDTNLYLEALQEGAFDLITPPFVASDVAHVVRSAASNVVRRREKEGQGASWS
jgi:DNA-binding NtrC family response regulator